MPISSITKVAGLLALSAAAIGCTPQQIPPPAATHASTSGTPPRTERHVYRFDFVVSTNDKGEAAPMSTAFTLNLQEGDKGEVTLGKNVSLAAMVPGTSGSGSTPLVNGLARQDVGLKVAAVFFTQSPSSDDALLDIVLEMSALDPPSTIRKMVAKGNTLAAVGKPALVTTLDDDKKHYQLTVTPTKLR